MLWACIIFKESYPPPTSARNTPNLPLQTWGPGLSLGFSVQGSGSVTHVWMHFNAFFMKTPNKHRRARMMLLLTEDASESKGAQQASFFVIRHFICLMNSCCLMFLQQPIGLLPQLQSLNMAPTKLRDSGNDASRLSRQRLHWWRRT